MSCLTSSWLSKESCCCYLLPQPGQDCGWWEGYLTLHPRLTVVIWIKDDIAYWQKLSDLKESHPLQVTEFVLAIDIPNEPAWTGGWYGLSRIETRLSPWLSAKVLDTTNALTSMDLNYPRLLRRLMPSIVPPVPPSGVIRLKRRWKMGMLHLTFLGTVSHHYQITSTYAVTWSLTSKWRISATRPSS